jgi:hypothetical protein
VGLVVEELAAALSGHLEAGAAEVGDLQEVDENLAAGLVVGREMVGRAEVDPRSGERRRATRFEDRLRGDELEAGKASPPDGRRGIRRSGGRRWRGAP